MKNSKLLSAMLSVALMFANMACACSPGESSMAPGAHQHGTVHAHESALTEDRAGDMTASMAADTKAAMTTATTGAAQTAMPCSHRDCQGCAEQLDGCSSTDYSLASADREKQVPGPDSVDADGPDLDLAYIDTGQYLPTPPAGSPLRSAQPYSLRVLDSPIRRKDQLTE